MLHSRERRFAFVYLLLVLNALTTFAAAAVVLRGWGTAILSLFDVSAIVWLAIAAMAALLWRVSEPQAVRPGDRLAITLAIVAALLPVPTASTAALTLVAGWLWLTSPNGSPLRRASAIAFSLTATLLWGRVMLSWGSGLFLAADARFVALIAGTRNAGNAVFFPDGTHFVIAEGCSSLHGVSLALVLWVTVVQYFRLRIDRRAWLTLAAAVLGAVLVNGVRLAVIARHPLEFDYWHTGDGGAMFGWLALVVIVAVVYRGASRALRLA